MFKNARLRKGHVRGGNQRYLRRCPVYWFNLWRKIGRDLNVASENTRFDPCDAKPRRSVHHTQHAFQCKALTLLFSSQRKLSCSDPMTTLVTTSSFVMIFYVLTTSFLFSRPALCPAPLVASMLLCCCGQPWPFNGVLAKTRYCGASQT